MKLLETTSYHNPSRDDHVTDGEVEGLFALAERVAAGMSARSSTVGGWHAVAGGRELWSNVRRKCPEVWPFGYETNGRKAVMRLERTDMDFGYGGSEAKLTLDFGYVERLGDVGLGGGSSWLMFTLWPGHRTFDVQLSYMTVSSVNDADWMAKWERRMHRRKFAFMREVLEAVLEALQ